MMRRLLQPATLLLGASLVVPTAHPAAEADSSTIAGPGVDVRLVAPAAGEVVEGKTPVEAAVVPRTDVNILKVDFYVDGERIGWRDDPPYRIEWDAGNSLRARQIRAVAYASDGETYEVTLRTGEIRVDYRERVSVVNVFATVRDFGGAYKGNLEADEFLIFEDGVQQTISHLAYEKLPLHVMFVLDASLSMKGKRIETAREAAERFARSLDYSRDVVGIVTFAGEPTMDVPLTGDRAAILEGIQTAQERAGGTALYDAILIAADALRPIEGRKAIILLSDGRDESGDGFRPGSVHTFEEALAGAHRADLIMYTIGVGKEIAEQKDFYGVRTVGTILTRLAEETGGGVYFATRVGQLRRAYENVADALRHQYDLGYSSTNPRRDGTWREIRVLCTREGYTVKARSGYYATGG